MRTEHPIVSLLIPAFMIVYFALAIVLPTVKVWRLTGEIPMTFLRAKAPLQKFVGGAFAVLLMLLLIGTGIYAWEPQAIAVWSVPAWIAGVGWTLMGTGLLITVAAQLQMGESWRIGIDSKPTKLVARGIFRLVRNPIFSSMLMTLLGLVLLIPSWPFVAGWIAIAGSIAFQTRLEERHLIGLHGVCYLEYAAGVGRFIPGLGRLKVEGMRA